MTPDPTIIMCPAKLTSYEDAEAFQKRILLHEPRDGSIVLDGSSLTQWANPGSNYLFGMLVDLLRRRAVLLVNWPEDAAAHTRSLWDLHSHLVLDRVFLPDDPKALKEPDVSARLRPRPRITRRRPDGEKGGVS